AHREPARVDVRAFLQERLDLVVDRQVTGERLLAYRGVAAGARREEDSGSVKHDAHVEPLATQSGRGEEVDECHRPLVRHCVDEDKGLLARICLDVLEDLLLGVVEVRALGGALHADCRLWHRFGHSCLGESHCWIAAVRGTLPCPPMAAWHPRHYAASGRPWQATVDGHEDTSPELRRRARRTHRRRAPDLSGEVGLSGLEEISLRVVAKPPGQAEVGPVYGPAR